jgi:transaldolase
LIEKRIEMKNPLVELQQLGQSPWHDNIRRSLLTSGALQKMIADGDITGLTSNPTIFEQAIKGSDDYRAPIASLAQQGKNSEEIFDVLSIEDIRAAADAFAGVYQRTAGQDGFVSIEVTPKYANDAQKTVEEAKRLWRTIDRPNLMIKIPATPAGVKAVEQTIAAGINVNVTLIFSRERYIEVMDSYISGLEKRVASGQRIDRVASVASFFISRVDTMVDQLLEEKKAAGGDPSLNQLKGQAAIANAKLAYADFKKRFATKRFGALSSAQPQLQRPLWASTSTKNPALSDVYYIEPLIGPHSVNTMPPATIAAYKDHGKPALRIEDGTAEAEQLFAQLGKAGIDMAAVTGKLEADGVASFIKSYDSLIAAVESQRGTGGK